MTEEQITHIYTYLQNGGRILSYSSNYIRIENYPTIPMSKDENALFYLIHELYKLQRERDILLHRLKPHWLQMQKESQ